MVFVKREALIALIAMAVMSAPASSAFALDVTGLWMTDDGEGAVQIDACGSMRCGRIVWLKDPLDDHGKPQRDVNNPSPEARQRPICGAQILSGLTRQDDESWDGGQIYDPEEGKSYKVMLKPSANGRLEVTGYVGLKLLGKTVIWTRSDHLKPCVSEAKPPVGK